ncbi:unnamed protein product, partial [Rotaria magnacalcarata]
KENVFEWLGETESKFRKFRMVRSLRFRAIPMLIEGDIELKYFRVRDHIRTFEDFYVFLLSLYDPEFSTSSEAQFFLKLLDNQFDNPSTAKAESSDEHDYCQIKSIDYFCESLSSEFVTNCSLPLEEKCFTIVTENASNEKFSMTPISTDNTMISSNSFDIIGSQQEIDVSSLNIDTNIGAAKILGVPPAEKVPIVIHKALHNRLKVNNESLKKKLKSSTRSQTYRVDSTRYINHVSKLSHISNLYQLDFLLDPLGPNLLCRYIYNRIKHSVCRTVFVFDVDADGNLLPANGDTWHYASLYVPVITARKIL